MQVTPFDGTTPAAVTSPAQSGEYIPPLAGAPAPPVAGVPADPVAGAPAADEPPAPVAGEPAWGTEPLPAAVLGLPAVGVTGAAPATPPPGASFEPAQPIALRVQAATQVSTETRMIRSMA